MAAAARTETSSPGTAPGLGIAFKWPPVEFHGMLAACRLLWHCPTALPATPVFPTCTQLEKHTKALSTVAKQIQFQFQTLSAAFLTSVLASVFKLKLAESSAQLLEITWGEYK